MAVPAGPYVEGFVEALAKRLTDVASQLYDLDQSTSMAVIQDIDKYTGRTREVLADVAHDRTWLWPAYTEARERVELAAEHVKRRQWDEARQLVVGRLSLSEVPPHDDLDEAVQLIADTARAVLEVALLVVPRIGQHLGELSSLRSQLGAVEEQAAAVGMTHAAEVQAARVAVDEAMDSVSLDPLSVDPVFATQAVSLARDVVNQAREDLQRLPRRLGQADTLLLEIQVLVDRGREQLDRARAKIARPQGLLVPLAHDVLDVGAQALRPWLERLSRSAAEGDSRAALMGIRSWERAARQLQEKAQQILEANEAPVERRDELRGLVGALQAKAAASGLAEDAEAEALHQAAREHLWVAPCDLEKAEEAVEQYRKFLVDR